MKKFFTAILLVSLFVTAGFIWASCSNQNKASAQVEQTEKVCDSEKADKACCAEKKEGCCAEGKEGCTATEGEKKACCAEGKEGCKATAEGETKACCAEKEKNAKN